jgi:hypothetical protein
MESNQKEIENLRVALNEAKLLGIQPGPALN